MLNVQHDANRLLLLLAALLTSAGCGTAVLQIPSYIPPRIEVPEESERLAVLPFDVAGPEGAGRWLEGEEVSQEIAAVIGSRTQLDLVSRKAVREALAEEGAMSEVRNDPETRRRVARTLRADLLLYGAARFVSAEPPDRTRPGVALQFKLAGRAADAPLAEPSVFEEIEGAPTTGEAARAAVRGAAERLADMLKPEKIQVERRLLAGKTDTAGAGYGKALDGDWQSAGQFWQQAIRLNPDDYAALNNMGVYSERAGKPRLAREYYRRALRFAPGDPLIEKNLEDLEQQVLKL